MALPADFSKIFGSTATGGLTPIGDVNYAKGWEFVGSNPPTKNDFSYLQNLSDLKSQWLYSNKLQRANPFGDIKSDGAAAVKKALENLGLRGAVTGTESILRIPAFINGQPGTYVIQTQTLTSNTSSGLIVFPEAFNNKCMIIIAVDYASAHVDNSRVRFNIPTKSQCEWFGQTASVSPTPVSPSSWAWMAIGY